jgi:hypothetical protein
MTPISEEADEYLGDYELISCSNKLLMKGGFNAFINSYFIAFNYTKYILLTFIINIFVSNEMVDFSNSKPGKWQMQSQNIKFEILSVISAHS